MSDRSCDQRCGNCWYWLRANLQGKRPSEVALCSWAKYAPTAEWVKGVPDPFMGPDDGIKCAVWMWMGTASRGGR